MGVPRVFRPQRLLLPRVVQGWSAYLCCVQHMVMALPPVLLLLVYYMAMRVVLGIMEAACHEKIFTVHSKYRQVYGCCCMLRRTVVPVLQEACEAL